MDYVTLIRIAVIRYTCFPPRSQSVLLVSDTEKDLRTWSTNRSHPAPKSTLCPRLAWSSHSRSVCRGTSSKECTSRKTRQEKSVFPGHLHTSPRLNSSRRRMPSTRCVHLHHMRLCSMTLQRNSLDQVNMMGRKLARTKTVSILALGTSHQVMLSYPNKENVLKTTIKRGREPSQAQAYIRTSLLKRGGITVSLSLDPQRGRTWLMAHLRVRKLINLLIKLKIETPGPGAYRAQSDFGLYDVADSFTGGHPRSTTALK